MHAALRQVITPCSLVIEKIKEDEDGWYFPYQSKNYIETGDFDKSLVGNWPIFVSREGGFVGIRRPGMPLQSPKD
jgi:hypothetical protein